MLQIANQHCYNFVKSYGENKNIYGKAWLVTGVVVMVLATAIGSGAVTGAQEILPPPAP
jgi:hypothetical protein